MKSAITLSAEEFRAETMLSSKILNIQAEGGADLFKIQYETHKQKYTHKQNMKYFTEISSSEIFRLCIKIFKTKR